LLFVADGNRSWLGDWGDGFQRSRQIGGLEPHQLFDLLQGWPAGPELFKVLMRWRCRRRELAGWLLERWLLLGLPGQGWAIRQRHGVLASWQRDYSSLRYVLARLTRQPD
jgi:hypothetical protein